MAYFDISLLAADQDFAQRCMAAYAVETLGSHPADDPPTWWARHCWDVAAQPGFGDQYASALAAEVPRPGRDPGVLPDPELLAAVQALVGTG